MIASVKYPSSWLILAALLLWGCNRTAEQFSAPQKEIQADIFIYGASLGGLSAAITAAENGSSVVIATDQTAIGGQAVTSGVSAFDDSYGSWEHFGIYKDLQDFLIKKYPSSSAAHIGLGNAVVGSVATLPADIEEFFETRIMEVGNITVLKGVKLDSLKKEDDEWVGAELLDIKSKQRTTVRFTYLLDGTPTGKVMAKANLPTIFGFDDAEKTNEETALPEKLKNILVSKYQNRGQSVATPFVIADKGFSGEFFPVEDKGCGKKSRITSFMSGHNVRNFSNCAAEIDIHVPFGDTYDVYWINHNNYDIGIQMTFSNGISFDIDHSFDQEEPFVKIGSFYLDSETSVHLSFTGKNQAVLMAEGIILTRKNLRQPPLTITRGQKPAIPPWQLSYLKADIYAVTNEDSPPSTSISIDGIDASLEKVSDDTYVARNVSVTRDSMIQPTENFSKIVIIPTGIDYPGRTVFTDKSAQNQSDTVKLWTFTAEETGEHILSLDWGDVRWATLQITDTSGKLILKTSFKNRNTTRAANPLLSFSAQKGHTYQISLTVLEFTWTPFVLSIDPLSKTNTASQKEPSAPLLTPFPGIYDVWVKGSLNSIQDVASAYAKNSDIIKQRDLYHHAGKYFLSDSISVHGNQETTDMLAILNTDVDFLAYQPISNGDAEFSIPLNGKLEGIFSTKNEIEADHVDVTEKNNATSRQTIRIEKNKEGFSLKVPLANKSSPLLWSRPFEKGDVAYFYETIPHYPQAFTFVIQMPVFEKLPQASFNLTVFNWRNIVSGNNLESLKHPSVDALDFSKNNMGMTLVMDPGSDYAPVTEPLLDSPELVENSKLHSYAYYYWLKYDSKKRQRILGCDPALLFCDMKRIEVILGIFTDPYEIFPSLPYYREGRRLVTKQMTTARDIATLVKDCQAETCNAEVCASISSNGKICVEPGQEAAIFKDALLATSYPIDLHSFFSKTENYIKDIQDAGYKDKAASFLKSLPSKPTSVRLSSLLAAIETNILPTSANIGVSQIANGAYRTHINEMRIGESIGMLLSFCMKRNIRPYDLLTSQALLDVFRHELIESDMMIFPVNESTDDPILRKAIQHLIVDYDIRPDVTAVARTTQLKYSIDAKKMLTGDDASVLASVFPSISVSYGDVTYGDILEALAFEISEFDSPEHQTLRKIFPPNTTKGNIKELLPQRVPKGFLYKAAYLEKKQKYATH